MISHVEWEKIPYFKFYTNSFYRSRSVESSQNNLRAAKIFPKLIFFSKFKIKSFLLKLIFKINSKLRVFLIIIQ